MQAALKHLLLLCVIVSSALSGKCQETLANDSGIVSPFKGELRYQISWKGKAMEDLKGLLPDSMIVLAADDGFSVRFFGGMSDTLMEELIWERNTGRLLAIYPYLSTAWESYPDKKDTLIPKLKKEVRIEKILGKSCRMYSLKWNNKEWKEEFWIWDSTRFIGIGDSVPLNQVPPIFIAGLKGLPMKYIRSNATLTSTAEIKEIVPMPGLVPLPVPGEGIQISPLPSRANLKHPVFEESRKRQGK